MRQALLNARRSEIRVAPPVSFEERTGVLAGGFTENLQRLYLQKREQRDSALKLAHEVKYVHVFYEDLLVFFGIEARFLRWSISNCAGEKVHEVRAALAEWRELLQEYCRRFPPSRRDFQSYTAMQSLMSEAQRTAEMVRAGFRVIDTYLAPRTVVAEGPERVALAA